MVMLEDESGRIPLVGEKVKKAGLVTGVTVGILGMETNNGEFEVVDVCLAGLAPKEEAKRTAGDEVMSSKRKKEEEGDKMEVDVDDANATTPDEWIAVVSGLDIGSLSPPDAQVQMLIEYLTGEAGGPSHQIVPAAHISRLVIAGNAYASQGSGEEEVLGEGKKPVSLPSSTFTV